MTTPAQGNLSGSSGKPEAGFEASGLSPEEAERLAAEFKPSWEFDEVPASQASAHANGSYAPDSHGDLHRQNGDARTVPPHAPPQRVETHEPEVSVIIDRSITAAEMDAQRAAAVQAPPSRPPVAAAAPYAAPAFAAPVPQRVAPVMRPPRSPDDSLALPTSLNKSNKGLFIGLGVAVAAAGLVLVIHGAMSSSSDSPSPTATATSTVAAESTQRTSIPPIPPPPAATAAAPPSAPATAAPPTVSIAALPSVPQHAAAPGPRAQAVHAPPPPAPPPPVVHHAAPRTPPKAPGGGIVRDNPF